MWLTAEQADEAVENGADALTAMQEKISGVPLSVLNSYRDLEAKYQDVRALEKGPRRAAFRIVECQ